MYVCVHHKCMLNKKLSNCFLMAYYFALPPKMSESSLLTTTGKFCLVLDISHCSRCVVVSYGSFNLYLLNN